MIKNKLEDGRLIIITGDVEIDSSSSNGFSAIKEYIKSIDDVSKFNNKIFESNRKMYRKFGKDPTKFRPSAEALIRRVIKEKNLYRVNDLVDLNNLYSIKTGYCIGNYDLDKIKGNIIYDKSENNAYLTISRGMINISGIYALKDDLGEFGNSTSDSLRTSIDENSKKILIVIYDFYQKENAILLAEQLIKLLEDNIKISKIKYEVRVKDEAN